MHYIFPAVFRRNDFFYEHWAEGRFSPFFYPVFLKYNYLLFVHGRDTVIIHQVRSSWKQ